LLARSAGAFTLKGAFDEDGGPNPWFYEMPEPGFNYRAPDILCALGLSQLRKVARFTAQRRELIALYREALAPLAPVVKPLIEPGLIHQFRLSVAPGQC